MGELSMCRSRLCLINVETQLQIPKPPKVATKVSRTAISLLGSGFNIQYFNLYASQIHPRSNCGFRLERSSTKPLPSFPFSDLPRRLGSLGRVNPIAS